MKLSNKEIQPYRIWYEYLQTALNDKSFSNKVNKNFYKDWHLNLVKKQKFNQICYHSLHRNEERE